MCDDVVCGVAAGGLLVSQAAVVCDGRYGWRMASGGT